MNNTEAAYRLEVSTGQWWLAVRGGEIQTPFWCMLPRAKMHDDASVRAHCKEFQITNDAGRRRSRPFALAPYRSRIWRAPDVHTIRSFQLPWDDDREATT
jgi:hypothetical protein